MSFICSKYGALGMSCSRTQLVTDAALNPLAHYVRTEAAFGA